MPDYVLKNPKTAGVYVLSTPNGAGEEYLAEAAAPYVASGWEFDTKTDPAEVPPPIQQPPAVASFAASTEQPEPTLVPDSTPKSAPVQSDPTKEIS